MSLKPVKPERKREVMTFKDKIENTRRDRNVQFEWIEACLNCDRLTQWEVDFVVSLEDQFSRGSRLSDKQLDILERIYSEKT